jgi:hypothetical protein
MGNVEKILGRIQTSKRLISVSREIRSLHVTNHSGIDMSRMD